MLCAALALAAPELASGQVEVPWPLSGPWGRVELIKPIPGGSYGDVTAATSSLDAIVAVPFESFWTVFVRGGITYANSPGGYGHAAIHKPRIGALLNHRTLGYFEAHVDVPVGTEIGGRRASEVIALSDPIDISRYDETLGLSFGVSANPEFELESGIRVGGRFGAEARFEEQGPGQELFGLLAVRGNAPVGDFRVGAGLSSNARIAGGPEGSPNPRLLLGSVDLAWNGPGAPQLFARFPINERARALAADVVVGVRASLGG